MSIAPQRLCSSDTGSFPAVVTTSGCCPTDFLGYCPPPVCCSVGWWLTTCSAVLQRCSLHMDFVFLKPRPCVHCQHGSRAHGTQYKTKYRNRTPSRPPTAVPQAFDAWRAKHWSTALGIRRLLAGEAGGANEAALVRLVAEAQHELWSYFQLKRAVVGGCVFRCFPALGITGRGRVRIRLRSRRSCRSRLVQLGLGKADLVVSSL